MFLKLMAYVIETFSEQFHMGGLRLLDRNLYGIES